MVVMLEYISKCLIEIIKTLSYQPDSLFLNNFSSSSIWILTKSFISNSKINFIVSIVIIIIIFFFCAKVLTDLKQKNF